MSEHSSIRQNCRHRLVTPGKQYSSDQICDKGPKCEDCTGCEKKHPARCQFGANCTLYYRVLNNQNHTEDDLDHVVAFLHYNNEWNDPKCPIFGETICSKHCRLHSMHH